MDNTKLVKKRFEESIFVKQKILNDPNLVCDIAGLGEAMVQTVKNDGTIFICGNGGSASDALHIVGEIVGRFQKERKAASAVALNSDIATMTAIANDYGFDQIYARQIEGLMRENDLLIGITTSGNSENIIQAINKAKIIGCKTACLTGGTGGKSKESVDFPIVVPDNITARIQESHILIGHILCEIVEEQLR